MSCFIGQLITTTTTSLVTTDRSPLWDDRSRWKKLMNTSVAYGGGVYHSVCSFDPSSRANVLIKLLKTVRFLVTWEAVEHGGP